MLCGKRARRLRTLILSLTYESEITQGQSNPIDYVLEGLLRALDTVSSELEDILTAHNWDQLEGVTFRFKDYQSWSGDRVRLLMTSLRSRMAAMFPKLHRRGLLEVTFLATDG